MKKDGHDDRTVRPWWAEDAPDDAPLPPGYPERPDPRKLDDLRTRVTRDRDARRDPHRTRLHDRLGDQAGRSARDIGSYTLIPMMLLAGPAVGYLVGRWLEGRLGGEPWLGVGGILFGLVAAARQIVLMLRKDGPSRE